MHNDTVYYRRAQKTGCGHKFARRALANMRFDVAVRVGSL